MSNTNNNQEQTGGETATVTITVIFLIIGVVIAFGLGIYTLWKWFLGEEKDAKILDRFNGLIEETVNLAFPQGALEALKQQQPDAVRERMTAMIAERYGVKEDDDDYQEGDDEVIGYTNDVELDENGLPIGDVSDEQKITRGQERRYRRNMTPQTRQLQNRLDNLKRDTGKQTGREGGSTVGFSPVAGTSEGGEVPTREPASARKKIKKKGKK